MAYNDYYYHVALQSLDFANRREMQFKKQLDDAKKASDKMNELNSTFEMFTKTSSKIITQLFNNIIPDNVMNTIVRDIILEYGTDVTIKQTQVLIAADNQWGKQCYALFIPTINYQDKLSALGFDISAVIGGQVTQNKSPATTATNTSEEATDSYNISSGSEENVTLDSSDESTDKSTDNSMDRNTDSSSESEDMGEPQLTDHTPIGKLYALYDTIILNISGKLPGTGLSVYSFDHLKSLISVFDDTMVGYLTHKKVISLEQLRKK